MVGRERLGKRAGPLSVKKENYFRGGGGNYLPPNSSYKKTQPLEIAPNHAHPERERVPNSGLLGVSERK